jgi:hypothetical protein
MATNFPSNNDVKCGEPPLKFEHDVKIVPEFKRAHKNLCHQLGIEENPEWVNGIIDMVI